MLGNGILLSLSSLLEKLFAFAIVVFAARYFGDEGIGEFFFYFSLISLCIPFMDAGFEKLYLTRASPKQGNDALLSELFLAKLLMGAMTFLGLLGITYFFLEDANLAALTGCFLAVFFDEIGQLLRTPAQLLHRHHLQVVVPLLARALTLVGLLVLAPKLSRGYQLAYLYAAANGLAAFLSLKGLCGTRIRLGLVKSLASVLEKIRKGIPFSLSHLFVMLSLFMDSVILGFYSMEAVGQYSVAYRIILVLAALSAGLAHVLFPVLSRDRDQKGSLDKKALIRDALRISLSVFGVLAIVAYYLGSSWIPLIYGHEFANSQRLFQLLVPLILLASLTNLLGQSLESLRLERYVWKVNCCGAIFNLLGNLLLIPLFGAQAAALTTVATEGLILMAFLGLMFPRLLEPKGWYLGRIMLLFGLTAGVCLSMSRLDSPILEPICAVALMGICLWTAPSLWWPSCTLYGTEEAHLCEY
jgi:O-antigen/teichoic acid export membrane protein